MVKISQSSGNWIKTSNIKDDDLIKILDEGYVCESKKYTYPDGTPKKQLVFQIEHKGETYSFTMNKASQINLGEVWGWDTCEWVGKTAKAYIMPSPIGTKMVLLKPAKENPEKRNPEMVYDPEQDAWDSDK